ncbi:HAMP domain-containing sensor histidine kinase [Lachnospiraceae bacterium JLR.KK009]|jgi:two-component system sensor histidine kinase VanS
MKKKLRKDIFIIQCLFLLFLTGICILLYMAFMPIYYEYVKDKQILQAYQDIAELDLSDLDDRECLMFANYENENLSFTIADENMKPVYVTEPVDNIDHTVQRNILKKLDAFSREPEINRNSGKLLETARYRGIMTQDGTDYYIVIKDIAAGRKSITMAEKFYMALFLVLMVPGSICMMLLWKALLKPLDQIVFAAGRAAEGEPGPRLEEEGRYQELNQLAKSMNRISLQMKEQNSQIEEGKRQMLHHNVRKDQVEKRRKEMIANISHELKTPLAVIASQTEMLGYTVDDREYYVASIQEEVAKMSDMVSRLLDSSVIEHQMESMIQKKIDMREVMDYIILKYEGMVKKKKLHLETFLSESCFVMGDREYIEQSVDNYMTNALEHTEIGGNIRITLKKQKSYIRVSVYNEGRQIPEEDLEHIWSGYYRNKREPKREENGFSHAGLGLYIVQSIVTMHNGSYGAENLPTGVEFWFKLPKYEEGQG